MEVITGWTHKAFPIDDASRVGEARRYAGQLAREVGLSEVETGQLSLVVTELGTNLLRHAQRGRLLVASRPELSDIEVVSLDEGPGIADLALAMQDGQSSGSTPGTGLGAVRRLSSEFAIHSTAPGGTVCVARVRKGGSGQAITDSRDFLLGAICLPAPGESVSGDGWAVAIESGRLCLLVADGLGHGSEAAKASQAAIAEFALSPSRQLQEMIQRIHGALRTTRGAAVCALTMDARDSELSYSGAGNIMGRIVSGVFDKSIVTQHGTAGAQIRRPEVATLELPAHAIVVVHSDGIETRWKADSVVGAMRLDPTVVAAILLRDHTRHRDDATVVVLRRMI